MKTNSPTNSVPGEEWGPKADVVSCSCTNPYASEKIAIHSTSFQGNAICAWEIWLRSACGIDRKAAPALAIVAMGNINRYVANHGKRNPFIVYTMSAEATIEAE